MTSSELPEATVDTRPDAQRTTLTTIRPASPEPEITAAGLPDPLGDLADPSHLRLEQYLPGDILGGSSPTPRISWEIASAPTGWTATSAELEITRTDLAGAPLASPWPPPTASWSPGPPRRSSPASASPCECA